MRVDLERLLEDITLVTLALAIAVGWSLYQLAHGVAILIDGLLTHVPSGGSGPFAVGLTWTVGHRVLDLDGLLYGVVELAVASGAAVLVARRTSS